MRASDSDRGVVCPASLVLPRTRVKSENAQKAADYGTLVHFWKETGDPEMPGASLRDMKVLEKKLLMSGIVRDEWWVGGKHEVSFALHLYDLTAERYPYRDGRDEWKAKFGPEYLTGTIDYLYEDGGGDDLKTGHWPVYAPRSKQLRSYALLPWAEKGCPSGWRKTWSITQWEKYPLAALPKRNAVELSSFDLRDHLDDLRYAVENPDETNATEEGCQFCDSKPDCPEYEDALGLLAS